MVLQVELPPSATRQVGDSTEFLDLSCSLAHPGHVAICGVNQDGPRTWGVSPLGLGLTQTWLL